MTMTIGVFRHSQYTL